MSIGHRIPVAALLLACLLGAAAPTQAIPLPEGPGAELVREQCGDCHATDRVAEQTLSRENWAELLRDMRHLGADFTDQERQRLLAYLTTYLGTSVHASVDVLPAGEGRDLVNGLCSACHSIRLVKQQRLAEWQWEDVLHDMKKYGAPLDDTIQPVILKYLVTHLGQ